MDTLTPQERSVRMSRVRSRDTKPELLLRKLVWSLGYRYRKNTANIVGRPDLAFPGRRRVIFLHGCFWHRHDCASGSRSPKSRIDFWDKKFTDNIRRDASVLRQLASIGWEALVIWECELRDLARIEHRVRNFLDA